MTSHDLAPDGLPYVVPGMIFDGVTEYHDRNPPGVASTWLLRMYGDGTRRFSDSQGASFPMTRLRANEARGWEQIGITFIQPHSPVDYRNGGFLAYDGTLTFESVNQDAYLLGWTDNAGTQHPGWKVEAGKIASDIHEARPHGHMHGRPGTFNQGHRPNFTTDEQSADMDESRQRDRVMFWLWRAAAGVVFERLRAWEALDAETGPWRDDLLVLTQIFDRLCKPQKGVCVGKWPRRFNRRCDPQTYLTSLSNGTVSLPDPAHTVWRPSLTLEQIPGEGRVERYDALMALCEDARHWYDDAVGIAHGAEQA